MGLFYLDIDNEADYWDQLTEVDGREYVLTFKWNDRAGAWFMDIADQDGDSIAYGIRIVCGIVPLTTGIIDTRLWSGDLFCFPTTQDESDPGRYDLGRRVLLVYDDLQPIAG